jgi:glycosyltransferase involved in cell wall biosynthesis
LLKILIVTPHIFEGGAEKAVLNLVYRLNSLGCDASIATLSVDLSKLPSNYAKLDFVLPEKPLEQPLLNDAKAVIASSLREISSFVPLLRKCSGGFDLICACNFPAYWATYLARTGKPVIWLSSEVLAPYNQTKDLYEKSRFFRIALRLAIAVDKFIVNNGVNSIVTCSELNSRLIKERYGRNALAIHTGVDYDFFNAEVPDAQADLGLGDGPLLLQVGALMQRKNQILSIRALKTLKQHLSSIKLVLVGDGPWKPILQEETEKLGLAEDVVCMGRVSEDELRSLYHACDVNLFPVTDQTWGLVPFEALAAGKPSIVAEGCGAAEYINREKIGFLIKPNVEDLVDAVLFAVKHPELAEDMVKRGQRFVQENLTWDKYASEMCVVFRNVLSRRKNTSARYPKS